MGMGSSCSRHAGAAEQRTRSIAMREVMSSLAMHELMSQPTNPCAHWMGMGSSLPAGAAAASCRSLAEVVTVTDLQSPPMGRKMHAWSRSGHSTGRHSRQTPG